MLNAQAVLITCWIFVVGSVEAGDARSVNRSRGCGARGERQAWVGELRVIHRDVQAEWNVRTSIVHVVALDALIHDAETAADDRLAVAGQIVRKAEPRTKGRPVVIHQAFGHTVLTRDADAIQV